MEKTGEDESRSNPKALIAFAGAQKTVASNQFDNEHDKMVIVFDTDIYKNKREDYEKILKLGGSDDILAVSNPSFELFLLLHLENSYEEIIKPNEDEILENKKEGKTRYIAKLLSTSCGMNPKTNSSIGNLAVNINTAILQEKKVNQNREEAIGKITCNIASIIQMIKEDTGPNQVK